MADVWTDVNSWNPEWEAKYETWVRENWQVDIFSRDTLPNGQSNPYKGMRTDCADTVYSMRMIFAFENKLPFVIQDPTSPTGTISNRLKRFNSISREIDRFREFLWFMYAVVSTESIPNDTYPIPITREFVKSGATMATTHTNHHSWSVKDILPIGIPYLVFNSRVSASSGSGLQSRQSWPNPYWVFEGNSTLSGNAGFRYWRPVEYLNTPVWNIPNYSDEQYHVPLDKWENWATRRLALSNESTQAQITRLYQTACDGMKTRVAAVNDGLRYLESNHACMDYETYDNYSTPNRDQRVFDDLLALRRAFKNAVNAGKVNDLPAGLQSELRKVFPFISERASVETAKMTVPPFNYSASCQIQYRDGARIDLAEAKRRMFKGWMSNNPHDPVEYRWGELPGPSDLARRCQSWDPWAPSFGAD